jgi:hypothetical protein
LLDAAGTSHFANYRSLGLFQEHGNGCNFTGELPTGRAEILLIKGSASAFGGQALCNSFDTGFAGLGPMRMSASQRLSQDNRTTIKF